MFWTVLQSWWLFQSTDLFQGQGASSLFFFLDLCSILLSLLACVAKDTTALDTNESVAKAHLQPRWRSEHQPLWPIQDSITMSSWVVLHHASTYGSKESANTIWHLVISSGKWLVLVAKAPTDLLKKHLNDQNAFRNLTVFEYLARISMISLGAIQICFLYGELQCCWRASSVGGSVENATGSKKWDPKFASQWHFDPVAILPACIC